MHVFRTWCAYPCLHACTQVSDGVFPTAVCEWPVYITYMCALRFYIQTHALTHTYPDDGVFATTVSVVDDDGGVGTSTCTITVSGWVTGMIMSPSSEHDKKGEHDQEIMT